MREMGLLRLSLVLLLGPSLSSGTQSTQMTFEKVNNKNICLVKETTKNEEKYLTAKNMKFVRQVKYKTN
jgi:hypothetical protein